MNKNRFEIKISTTCDFMYAEFDEEGNKDEYRQVDECIAIQILRALVNGAK